MFEDEKTGAYIQNPNGFCSLTHESGVRRLFSLRRVIDGAFPSFGQLMFDFLERRKA